MPNMIGVPEISVRQVEQKLKNGDKFVLWDVREPWELQLVRLSDKRLVLTPLSRLAEVGLRALPPEVQDRAAEIVVVCHHGVRSAQVTYWLRQQGWQNVVSMAGGVDAYAREVDSSIGSYT